MTYFNSEKKARDFLKDNFKNIFSNNIGLVLLYVKKINDNRYELVSELDTVLDKRLGVSFPKTIIYKDLSIQTSKGAIFYPINSNGEMLHGGDTIRNKYRKRFEGKLGFIFQELNSKKFYIATNKHVIGREDFIGDIIQKKVGKNNFKDVGILSFSIIDEFIDVAVAELNNRYNPTENNSISLSTSIKFNEDIYINNIKQQIVSKYAYVKVKSKYFYNPYKILQEQIISNNEAQYGNSGSLAFNSKKQASGLLVAKSSSNRSSIYNSGYSVMNYINIVLQYISNELNTKIEYIKIINQFKL